MAHQPLQYGALKAHYSKNVHANTTGMPGTLDSEEKGYEATFNVMDRNQGTSDEKKLDCFFANFFLPPPPFCSTVMSSFSLRGKSVPVWVFTQELCLPKLASCLEIAPNEVQVHRSWVLWSLLEGLDSLLGKLMLSFSPCTFLQEDIRKRTWLQFSSSLSVRYCYDTYQQTSWVLGIWFLFR